MLSTLLSKPVCQLTDPQLVNVITQLNISYRRGQPLVSDDEFDQTYLSELRSRNPEHVLLRTVQPDASAAALTSKGRVAHPAPMLSTNKAYTEMELRAFIQRCEQAAGRLAIQPSTLLYRITPKFDGIAIRFNATEKTFTTRGDGLQGNDVSHLLKRGAIIVGDASQDGVGELVISTDYFESSELSQIFDHPRNMVAGMAASDTMNEHAQKVLADGKLHLVLYRDWDAPTLTAEQLLADFGSIEQSMYDQSPYPLDGIIIEAIDPALKSQMGHSSHHHHWQLAFKRHSETAEVQVLNVTYQTGRSGRVSPVINIEPTALSGCTISNVTGHHAGRIRSEGIGPGATITITRQGLVIPKLLRVNKPVEPMLVDNCPACGSEVHWENDFLVCQGDSCCAQKARVLQHFAKTVMLEYIGPTAAEQLVAAGVDSVEAMLDCNESTLLRAGFGHGQAANILQEIQRLLSEPLSDHLLLASLGISKLGRGASKKILLEHPLDHIPAITANEIVAIRGFEQKSANIILSGLSAKRDTLRYLLSAGFNRVAVSAPVASSHALCGVHVVFTGKMESPRSDMEAQAAAFGAIVQKSVNKKTQLLVTGANVGAAKLNKATELGIEQVSEQAYQKKYVTAQ
ncbi:hypothetical protein IC617_08300 [Neiella sp. HB171785]|uniref:DNA ligase (NAD(+)) n=1 Tax=Neiella litorisoli TaxID=2771431 RepID=A0A8J6R2S2_9GAMM|nr:BRCT domain-containing protein [Neiella litorisoli]MBD1389425.1 hypothetical protein [Neiella litorisoli]